MSIKSENFRVPVKEVLRGAKHLHSVVVVGIDSNGSTYVASSVGTPQTLNMIAQGPKLIAEQAVGA